MHNLDPDKLIHSVRSLLSIAKPQVPTSPFACDIPSENLLETLDQLTTPRVLQKTGDVTEREMQNKVDSE